MSKISIKVPQFIKVLTHTYKVVFDSHLWHESSFSGQAHHRIQILSFDPSIALSERSVSLIHELLEIIRRQYSLDLGHDDLDRLAQALMQFLADLNIEFDWSDINEGSN